MEGKAMGSRTKNSVKNVFFSELSYEIGRAHV